MRRRGCAWRTRARALGRPHAAREVARDLLELAGIGLDAGERRCRDARWGRRRGVETARARGRATRTCTSMSCESTGGVRVMFRGRVRHVHFVGIGGIGMSGLAEILRTLEFDVSGSDLRENDITKRLGELGRAHRHGAPGGERARRRRGRLLERHRRRTTPRSSRRGRCGIPVIARAEMLAELMRVKYGVAIAGSHGKTTTTSLVATVLRAAGLDPTVVVGGKMAALGSNARLGAGDLLVAEADESDGSFLRLTPTDGGRHQHRPRAPRSLRHAREGQRGVRRVREPRAVLRPGRAVPRSPARAGHPAARVSAGT